MAGATLTQRIQLVGGDEFLAKLKSLGAEGEAAFKKIQAASDAVGTRGGFLSGVSAGVASVKKAFADLGVAGASVGRSFQQVGKSFGELRSSIKEGVKDVTLITAAVSGAVVGFIALAKSAADNAREITDLSRAFGVSTTAFQKYTDVAKIAGIEQDGLSKLLLKFDLGLVKTGESAAGAAKPLGDFAKNIVTLGGAASQFDGGVKIVRGLDDAAKAADGTAKAVTGAKNALLDGLVGTTVEDRLTEFSHKLAAIQDPIKKLAALTEGGLFDRRTAVNALNFFAAFEEGTKHILPVIDPLVLKLGTEAAVAFAGFTINLKRLKDGLLDTFAGPPLAEAANKFGDFLIKNQAKITAFAASIRDAAIPFIEDLFNALTGNDAEVKNKGIIEFRDAIIGIGVAAKVAFTDILIPAFQKIQAIANFAAKAINAAFGTNLSGNAILIAAAVLAVTNAFGILIAAAGALASVIGLVATTLGGLGTVIEAGIGVVAALVAAFGAIPIAIAAAIAATIAAAILLWPQLVAGATLAAQDIVAAFSGIGSAIASVFNQAVSAVESAFSGIVAFVQGIADQVASIVAGILSAIASADRAQSAAQNSQGVTPGGGLAFAGGGRVLGPGTGTSDSILARLSAGEFVINAKAVRHFGLDFVAAINSMRLPLDRLRGFSLGGMAEGLNRSLAIPRFAAGGLAALGPAAPALTHTLNLTIGGETFAGLMAPEDTAMQLLRYTGKRTMRSAGRPPSWA